MSMSTNIPFSLEQLSIGKLCLLWCVTRHRLNIVRNSALTDLYLLLDMLSKLVLFRCRILAAWCILMESVLHLFYLLLPDCFDMTETALYLHNSNFNYFSDMRFVDHHVRKRANAVWPTSTGKKPEVLKRDCKWQ